MTFAARPSGTFYTSSGAPPPPPVVSVSISPFDRQEVGFANSFTFGSFTATVTGGSPSAIVWSFRNTVGGTWTVNSGQGTLTATPRVTGIPTGGFVSADFTVTVTVSGVDYSASAFLFYENLNS